MEAREEKRPNFLFIFIIILILVLIISLLYYFIKKRNSITINSEITGSQKVISLSNSYIFAAPVKANAGGDLIRITVFLLDNRGYGVFDKKVILGNNNGPITINNLQSLTDETGKAVFDISSTTTGVFFIEASVDGNLLSQRVKVTFD
jgi:hypothetical protein